MHLAIAAVICWTTDFTRQSTTLIQHYVGNLAEQHIYHAGCFVYSAQSEVARLLPAVYVHMTHVVF